MEAVEMRERLSGIPASAGELRMCKRVVLSVFFATLSTNMDTSRKFAGYQHLLLQYVTQLNIGLSCRTSEREPRTRPIGRIKELPKRKI
jgi:hypothetical protein